MQGGCAGAACNRTRTRPDSVALAKNRMSLIGLSGAGKDRRLSEAGLSTKRERDQGTKQVDNDLKTELYGLWQAQENLLQQYRSMGLTHQSIIAAGALLIITLFDDKWADYRGILLSPQSIDPSLLLPFLIKSALLFIFIFIGAKGTQAFSSMVLHRAECVNFCQNLIFMFENDTLQEFIGERRFQAFSSLMRFAGSEASLTRIGAHPAGGETIDRLMDQFGPSARRDYSSHHFSRKYLNKPILDVFNIIWVASTVYWAIFVLFMFLR